MLMRNSTKPEKNNNKTNVTVCSNDFVVVFSFTSLWIYEVMCVQRRILCYIRLWCVCVLYHYITYGERLIRNVN